MKIAKMNRRKNSLNYAQCPFTHNRTVVCFRLCHPQKDGNGECGRLAPHGSRSRIQQAIDNYERQKQQ